MQALDHGHRFLESSPLQNADLDVEDNQHNINPGAWRDEAVMREVENAGRGPRQTAAGNRERIYYKNYFTSVVGSVPWQEMAIDM